MNLVWKKSRNQRTAMLLLLAIADHAHDDGKGAFPSIPTLARKTRQTERNVQLLLKTLEASSELDILEGQGPHGCNLYHINIKLLESYSDWESQDIESDDGEATTPSGENFSPPKTFHPENSRVENAENFTPPVKNSAQIAREISPEPSSESSINPKELTDAEILKTRVQTLLKENFHFSPDADWTWLESLCAEIPDLEFFQKHIERVRAMQSNSLFDQLSFIRSAKHEYARRNFTRTC